MLVPAGKHKAARSGRTCVTGPVFISPASCFVRRRHHRAVYVRCSSKSAEHAGLSEIASSQPLIERTYRSNWRAPLAGHDNTNSAHRPIIALGKFDALHKGHQSLAAAALTLGGSPVLLSFSGMGAVLGWQPRKPLVAPCDRPRVLDLWAKQLHPAAAGSSNGSSDALPDAQRQQQQEEDGGIVPIRQHYIPFSAIRSMSPEEFVELIVKDLKAAGVVAGTNYRFGYRAAGDSDLLRQLCTAAGLPVTIVDLVGPSEPGAVGVVSSSKIREMLAACRIEAARKSLGRPYRLVAAVNIGQQQQHGCQQQQDVDGLAAVSISGCTPDRTDSNQQAAAPAAQQQQQQQGSSDARIFVRQHDFLNQHPGPGVYLCKIHLLLGATGHDDLLQIQQILGSESQDLDPISSSSSSSSSSTDNADLSTSRQQQQQQTALSEITRVDSEIKVSKGLLIPGSGCFAAVTAQQQQVELQDGGLLLPAAVAAAAHEVISDVCGDLSMAWGSNDGPLDGVGSSSSSSSSGGSSSSSTAEADYSTSSSRLPGSGLDPLSWDTDDNEDDNYSVTNGVSALLVVDFERCLRQVCSVDRPSMSAAAASSSTSSSGVAGVPTSRL